REFVEGGERCRVRGVTAAHRPQASIAMTDIPHSCLRDAACCPCSYLTQEFGAPPAAERGRSRRDWPGFTSRPLLSVAAPPPGPVLASGLNSSSSSTMRTFAGWL